MNLGTTASRIADILFPPRCLGCGCFISPASDSRALCSACLDRWELEKMPKISEAISENGFKAVILSVCGYDSREGAPGIGKSIILKLKRNPLHHAARFIADEMLDTAYDFGLPQDCVITGVPRSRKGIKENGFDQVRLITDAMAESSGMQQLPFLRRVGGVAQKRLDKKHRQMNAAKSYLLDTEHLRELRGADVMLADDVSTTGSTLSACAELLVLGGAASVHCICFAGTIPYAEL